MFDQGLGDLALFRPHELAQAIMNPADRIPDIPVLWWVEQISECLPGSGGGQGHALTDFVRGIFRMHH
jgi:hypothetical protein